MQPRDLPRLPEVHLDRMRCPHRASARRHPGEPALHLQLSNPNSTGPDPSGRSCWLFGAMQKGHRLVALCAAEAEGFEPSMGLRPKPH